MYVDVRVKIPTKYQSFEVFPNSQKPPPLLSFGFHYFVVAIINKVIFISGSLSALIYSFYFIYIKK